MFQSYTVYIRFCVSNMGPFLHVNRFNVFPRFCKTVLLQIAMAACSFKTWVGVRRLLRRSYFFTRRVLIDFDTFLIQEQKVSTSAILVGSTFFLSIH